MNTSSATLRTRSGFTLVEMLVVVAIIGLLASIAFPAFGALQDKARAARTRNTLVGIVQGWTSLLHDCRRFPPVTMLNQISDSGTNDGDLHFPMNQQACNVLNWYTGDEKRYDEIVKNVNTGSKELPSTRSDGTRLVEQNFERNAIQWRYGILSHWGERKANSSAKKTDLTPYLIWVVLDTNGNNELTAPNRDVLKASVAAWCASAWSLEHPSKEPGLFGPSCTDRDIRSW